MHLFRWTRFLSWKRRHRPSSPRRSSRWLLRHFHRHASRGSSFSAQSIESLSVSSTFDVRPSMAMIEPPSDGSGRRSSLNDDTRTVSQALHPVSNDPVSPTNSQSSAVALARVSSLFHTTGRSTTLLERASIANMFNQLQFEMPPLPHDPAPPDNPMQDTIMTNEPTGSMHRKKRTRSQKRLAKRKLKKLQQRAAEVKALSENIIPLDNTEQVLARTEPSFFRQYMLRTKSRNSMTLEDLKFRPLSPEQCHAYLQSVVLSSPTIGSRGFETPPMSPVREPVEFLFFGGSNEDHPHRLYEFDTEHRRYRAEFVATQPTPSCTTSIHIKPTLVRGLPSVFEPRFESMYI